MHGVGPWAETDREACLHGSRSQLTCALELSEVLTWKKPRLYGALQRTDKNEMNQPRREDTRHWLRRLPLTEGIIWNLKLLRL